MKQKLEELQMLAAMCRLEYLDDPVGQLMELDERITDVKLFRTKKDKTDRRLDTQVIEIEHEAEFHVAYFNDDEVGPSAYLNVRGSETPMGGTAGESMNTGGRFNWGSLSDWADDARASMFKYIDSEDFGMHRGFFGRVEDIMSDAYASTRGRSVKLIGHSLGGATAMGLLAANFDANLIDVSGVVTFGCPRVLNKKARNHLRSGFRGKVTRCINHRDLVKELPFGFGYRHYDTEVVYLSDGGEAMLNPSLWEMIKDKVGDFATVDGETLQFMDVAADALKDHAIGSYEVAIAHARSLPLLAIDDASRLRLNPTLDLNADRTLEYAFDGEGSNGTWTWLLIRYKS